MTAHRRPAGSDWVEDAALLERHVAGDPDAFAELVARHRDRLWAVALRTLGDPDDAADALQDGLLRAFRRAETFRGEAAVTTWLHRVVVNACLDQVRRRRARPSHPVDPQEDSTLVNADRGLTWDHGDPEAAALAAERRVQVLAALATLPADQRAALVLVDMQGWPVQDAATVLDCPEGTVKSRCSRGRARLAPLLAEFSGGGAAVTLPTDGSRNQVAGRRVSSAGQARPVADDHDATGRAT